MATTMTMRISLVLALASMLFAQRASGQPSSSCTSAIVGLAPCVGYITGNSSSPTSSCCTQLASVVQTQARCLCALLNNGAAQFGLNINQTLALTLPGKCKVQTPPLSQCNAVSPALSPATAPAASPSAPATPGSSSTPTNPTAPSVPATPSGSGKGSNTVPTSPTGQSSDASSYKSVGAMIFAALFVVVSASTIAV